MCLHLYGHRAISLTGFFNGPVQSRRQTVRRSYSHRAVSAAVHRNRTDIARRPCGFRTEAVRRSYTDNFGISLKPSIISISAIGGNCWQGELCKQRCLTSNSTASYVATINYIPMCCPFCERSGFYLSSKECNCLHNGPDPEYQPTEAELREVEEFKRRLNGASPNAAMTGALILVALFGSMSAQYIS